jgi:uroporphyrinogen-III decarboxylase
MTRDDLSQECRRIIEAAKPGGGFVLCGGCEVPATTTDEILYTDRRAVDLYGSYQHTSPEEQS